MEKVITVRDLLALMFDGEPVEIVSESLLHKESGWILVKDKDCLSEDVLGAAVINFWRSVYNRIVIIIE